MAEATTDPTTTTTTSPPTTMTTVALPLFAALVGLLNAHVP